METCIKGLSREVRLTPPPPCLPLPLQIWLLSFQFPSKSLQKSPKSNLIPYQSARRWISACHLMRGAQGVPLKQPSSKWFAQGSCKPLLGWMALAFLVLQCFAWFSKISKPFFGLRLSANGLPKALANHPTIRRWALFQGVIGIIGEGYFFLWFKFEVVLAS